MSWGLETISIFIGIGLSLIGMVTGARSSNPTVSRILWGVALLSLTAVAFSVGGSIRNSMLAEDNIELKALNSKLRADLQTFQVQVDALTTTNERLKREVDIFSANNSRATNDGTEIENLRQENEQLQEELEEARQTIEELQATTSLTEDEDTDEPPSAPSNLVQQYRGATYTIVETTNSNGNVTLWLTVFNEAAEDNICLHNSSTIFDPEGNNWAISYFTANNNQSDDLCTWMTIPNRIERRFGVTINGLEPDIDLIPQFTLKVADISFRDIPIPYNSSN